MLNKMVCVLAVSAFFGYGVILADVIVSGTHKVDLCIKINMEQCDDIVIVQAVCCHSDGVTELLEVAESCLKPVYWACTSRLFWMSKEYFESNGGISSPTLKAAINAYPPLSKRAKSASAASVHLLKDSLSTAPQTVRDTDSTKSREIWYTAVKTESSVALYKTEETTTYVSGSQSTVNFPINPTRIVLGNPADNAVRAFSVRAQGTELVVTGYRTGAFDLAIANCRGNRIKTLTLRMTAGLAQTVSMRDLACGMYFIQIGTGPDSIAMPVTLVKDIPNTVRR